MVTVVIERHCKLGREKEFQKLLIQMRGIALNWHAHVSGEIYRNADDPSQWVTIVNWLTRDDWKAWKESPERREILSKMEPLLEEPEKIRVLEPVL